MTQGGLKCAATGLALCLLLGLAAPAASRAAFAIEPGSVKVQTLDSLNGADVRAGAHPDHIVLEFRIEAAGAATAARDLLFEFAPGLTGSPSATKTCSRAVFEFEECPANTEVGRFSASFLGGEGFKEPIYNLTPGPDQLAALGFKPFWQTELEMKLRPGDYGLDITTRSMPQLPFDDGHVELWGIPGDHNGSGERAAFLTTPTECGPMKFVLHTRSWLVGAPWLSETAETEPFAGCESLPFEPSLALHLTDPNPDSLTGARIDLNFVEYDGPDETVGADVKDAQIDLPAGLTLAPSGVEGRELCSDSQFGLGAESSAACPFQSRVGSVEITTPQLAEKLVGSIYLGQERPGERFRLLIEASARGIDYKTTAKLAADPQTGRLSTELADLPQFAVSQMSLSFEGGSHALLATPLSCGAATASARFVPYSGSGAVQSQTTVQIGKSCGGRQLPYSPGMTAGGSGLAAGHDTDFSLTLSRQPGEQLSGRFSTTLPPGLTADLASADLCPNDAAGAGACPPESRIGSAVATVGPGPSPAPVRGSVYMTERYRDAPFGLAIAFKAAIGPFDLGTLVVRGTLRIDPATGQITLEDPLPSVFEGVPLRFRTIGIDLDRPDFLVNPTSCETQALASTAWAVDGRASDVSNPFSVRHCAALGFRPRFGVGVTRRRANPRLWFSVKTPSGQANLKRLRVRFPRSLKFHNAGISEICPRETAAEDRCRPGARVGSVVASSPLIDGPLRGPVYMVRPAEDGGFPDLWSSIAGMGVRLRLRSESLRKHGSLVTELVDVPDLPLSRFTMRVRRGRGAALFTLARNACRRRGALATPVELEGQDGAIRLLHPAMRVGCPPSRHQKRIQRVALRRATG